MAKDEGAGKGKGKEAPKLKPETHRNKHRSKSHDEWTSFTRQWARMDPLTRELSKAIITFGVKKGKQFGLPAPRIFTQLLDKEAS